MLPVSAELEAHLASGTTTLCTCWRLIRQDGTIFGFTDHDRDLSFGNTTFLAATGLSGSEMESALGLAVGGGDVQGALTSAALTEADILAGRYDGSSVETWLVNWQDVGQRLLQDLSHLGEIRRSDQTFTAELRNAAAPYDEEKGRLYASRCDAEFGDARCGLSLSANDRRKIVPVTAVASNARLSFVSPPGIAAGALKEGRLRFTTGASQGAMVALVLHERSGGVDTVSFDRALAAGFAPGDMVEITIGCDKRFATCQAFANTPNFRGFPHIPTGDQVFGYAERANGLNDGGSLFQ
jgi:uncharacterized phage protein (TIGR02218 family)